MENIFLREANFYFQLLCPLSLYCSHSELGNSLTFTKTGNNKALTQILMVEEF